MSESTDNRTFANSNGNLISTFSVSLYFSAQYPIFLPSSAPDVDVDANVDAWINEYVNVTFNLLRLFDNNWIVLILLPVVEKLKEIVLNNTDPALGIKMRTMQT